jgi:hypothetical protein
LTRSLLYEQNNNNNNDLDDYSTSQIIANSISPAVGITTSISNLTNNRITTYNPRTSDQEEEEEEEEEDFLEDTEIIDEMNEEQTENLYNYNNKPRHRISIDLTANNINDGNF